MAADASTFSWDDAESVMSDVKSLGRLWAVTIDAISWEN